MMWIRILAFILMRILTLSGSRLNLHSSRVSLHGSIASLNRFSVSLPRCGHIRYLFCLHSASDPDPAFHLFADPDPTFHMMRIRIRLPKMMWIHVDPDLG
jgi:hypothetical protein